MKDRAFALLLRKTYHCRLKAFRPLPEGGEKTVYDEVACALSRTAKTASPNPVEQPLPLPETAYRLALYTPPEILLALGDRLEITDDTGRCYQGLASDSFFYPSHTVTVVNILEVTGGEQA